ncbi:MAG: hypothetical protein Ct9H300mP23_03130 [Nitrospinota bacterium]|nr:MAG: hypothetical protein Ct9H300mP23_03130 [Nitrospinota bacterium]
MKPNKNSYAFIFAVIFGICWIAPTAFSEDKNMDHGSMDHGSMDHISHGSFKFPSGFGDEYRTKPDKKWIMAIWTRQKRWQYFSNSGAIKIWE